MPTIPALKGHVFRPDSPLIPEDVRDSHPARLTEWMDRETERWKIVATCAECGEGLVQEELAAHRMGHVRERLRPISREMLLLTPAERLEVMGMFGEDGKLVGGE